MSSGTLLICDHDGSQYLLFLYQNIFPVVLLEHEHGFVKGTIV